MPARKSPVHAFRAWLAALIPFLILVATAHRPLMGLPRALATQRAEQAIADGRLAEAETRLEALVRDEPKNLSLRLRWVLALRRLGRITEAEVVLQRTIELGLPVEDARREHALLLAETDFARAEDLLARLLTANPWDEEIRATIERNAGDQRSAVSGQPE